MHISKFREISGQPSYVYGLSQYRILHRSTVIIIRHKNKEHSRTAAMLLCCTLQNLRGQSSRTHRGKSATYLIAEYHRGRLQSTPLGKLCTDASA